MKRLTGIISVLGASVLMVGCSGGGQPTFVADKEDNSIIRFQSVKPEMIKKYEKSRESENECSMHTYLYLAARETVANGNNYFVLADPGYGAKYDNNMMGFPITDSDALERYCNPALRSPNTGLEDDKCLARHMGDGIEIYYRGKIAMLKEKTHLFPTWDARETMAKEGAKANACIDWSKYKNAKSVKDIKVEY